MEFRRATSKDLDRLVQIHLAAYPDERGAGMRARNFTRNAWGSLRDLVVAQDAGRVVAHGFLYPFEASFGGRMVKVGGIASVGVAPEARGRGVASALMHELHARSDARGDAITMLYAFRHGFYARLGYATTSSKKRLAFAPESVPASWRALARERVRDARAADRRPLRDVHARIAARSSGWITRPRARWESRLLREDVFWLVCGSAKGSRVAGWVAFMLHKEEPHAETVLDVLELVADDDAARRALIGALGAMRDQVSEVLLEVGEADPLERALLDADRRRHGTETVEHGLGEIVGGPMVRIDDVARAIEARGYARDGRFDLLVHLDDHDDADAQEIAASVVVEEGRAVVGPARGGPALETTRAGLAAIFYGGLSVTAAAALDLAAVDERARERVDAIVRLPPLDPIDAF